MPCEMGGLLILVHNILINLRDLTSSLGPKARFTKGVLNLNLIVNEL